MSAQPRDLYEQETDGRREPSDDRSADEMVMDMEAKRNRGEKPALEDFDMLVTAYNFLSQHVTDAQLDECAVRMKAGGAQ